MSNLGTKYPDVFAALAAPFRRDMVKSRKHDGARYITARAVDTRLDEVLGPENWIASYEGWSDEAVVCRLTITLPDGVQLTKCNVGSYSKMSEKNATVDAGDDDKGGFSDAKKRAALEFGIGRHLYDDGRAVPVYETTPAYRHPASAEPIGTPSERAGRPTRDPAPCPEPAAASPPAPVLRAEPAGSKPPASKAPTSGKQLFAWVKDRETEYQVGLLRYLNGWAKLQEFPGRMVDWDAGQVSLAYAEATRKLDRLAESEVDAQQEAMAT